MNMFSKRGTILHRKQDIDQVCVNETFITLCPAVLKKKTYESCCLKSDSGNKH